MATTATLVTWRMEKAGASALDTRGPGSRVDNLCGLVPGWLQPYPDYNDILSSVNRAGDVFVANKGGHMQHKQLRYLLGV